MKKPKMQPATMPITPRNRHTRNSSRCSPNVIVLFSNRSSVGFLAMGWLLACGGRAGRICQADETTPRRRPDEIQAPQRAVRKLAHQRRGTYGGTLPYQ